MGPLHWQWILPDPPTDAGSEWDVSLESRSELFVLLERISLKQETNSGLGGFLKPYNNFVTLL